MSLFPTFKKKIFKRNKSEGDNNKSNLTSTKRTPKTCFEIVLFSDGRFVLTKLGKGSFRAVVPNFGSRVAHQRLMNIIH